MRRGAAIAAQGVGRFNDGVAVAQANPVTPDGAFLRRVFLTALGFFAVVAGLGARLRWSQVRPVPGFDYGHWLHAHSHTAFLGFVFNAFFALALTRFVPEQEWRGYRRLFSVLVFAVLGMLVAFPIQGYGAVSIAFSTLHMAAAGVFAWRLWRRNRAVPGVRAHLRAALVCLVASGLGPLALGPLAALDLRETAAYSLCIYFYLHAQYNGWFLFFLQALLLQPADGGARPPRETALAVRACAWSVAGVVLTLAQSTLWLDPPAWVQGVAALGGGAQLVGFLIFLRLLALRERGLSDAATGVVRGLWRLALAAWGLKILLQIAAAVPALAVLVNHRFLVIAFLHLVFLGVVTPAILAAGFAANWLRDTALMRCALGVFFAAAAVSELVLVALALGASSPVSLAWLLFAPTASMAGAALVIFVLAALMGDRR
jgi:hypothetical protein